MQSIEDIQEELANRREKITMALDVSGVGANCLFHCIAVFCIATQSALLVNLFTKCNRDSVVIKRLKDIFPSMEALNDFFGRYNDWLIHTNSDKALKFLPYDDPAFYIFEKTLILGVLLRNWFVNQLIEDKTSLDTHFEFKADSYTDERGITFSQLAQNYCLARRESGLVNFRAELMQNPIYQANLKFFNTAVAEESEAYFRKYWETDGYKNYCNYLKRSGIEISYGDIDSILNRLYSYAIYDSKTGKPIIAYDNPKLEMALGAKAAHYLLLPTHPGMETLFKEYSFQSETYLKERKNLLDLGLSFKYKEKIAESCYSTLLIATLPSSEQGGDLATTLLSALRKLQINMMEEPLLVESPNLLEGLLPKGGSLNLPNNVETAFNQATHRMQLLVEIGNRRDRHELSLRELEFFYLVQQLYTQASVLWLEGTLDPEFIDLIKDVNYDLLVELVAFLRRDREDYTTFRKNTLTIIAKDRTKLEQHPNLGSLLKQILGNLILAIMGLGIFYIAAVAVNYKLTGRFFFFPPEIAEVVSEIEATVPELEKRDLTGLPPL